MSAASWVIRVKATAEVLFETFDARKVAALNTAKYEAVPIGTYLASLNKTPVKVVIVDCEKAGLIGGPFMVVAMKDGKAASSCSGIRTLEAAESMRATLAHAYGVAA